MSLLKKIKKIENTVISLVGDKSSNGDKAFKKNPYISLEKIEDTFLELFDKNDLYLKREVIKAESNMQAYTENDGKSISTKIMYFANVDLLFSIFDMTSGESIEFKFSGTSNSNTNAGHAYGAAIKYARRKFFEVVFSVKTSDKDLIENNQTNNKNTTNEHNIEKLTFHKIDGPQNKQVYENGEYRNLTEDEKPIKEIHLKTLKSEVNKIYKEKAEEMLRLLIIRCRVTSLNQLPLKVYKELCMIKFDIENYKKIEKAI